MSRSVETNNITKKAKNERVALSFLTKCNSFEKVNIPIKQIRKIIIFVIPFPTKKEIGKQENNIFSNLKFDSEKSLEGVKSIFCI